MPVTIRTFDLGADKHKEDLDGLTRVAPNPALGLRAIRFCLAEPRLFLTQLRAILRATEYGNVRILIPMLASASEIDQTLAMIGRAKESLHEQGVPFDPSVKVGGMRAALILLIGFAGAAWAASGSAQTTAGTSATIVVPVVAQTSSFTSEVTVYNPNAGAITLSVAFYNAQNTTSPGAKTCNALLVPGGRSAAFTVTTQCALPTPPNFGLLILAEQTGTQRFHGYVRTQTPQGVGFSTEGFPIENFNDQLQHATGLKRAAASGVLPAYQTNCFVGSLGDAVSYEVRLFDGATGAQ